jgi:hypothetical protein
VRVFTSRFGREHHAKPVQVAGYVCVRSCACVRVCEWWREQVFVPNHGATGQQWLPFGCLRSVAHGAVGQGATVQRWQQTPACNRMPL